MAGGRSITIDIYAQDSEGKIYDVEVQRADNGANIKDSVKMVAGTQREISLCFGYYNNSFLMKLGKEKIVFLSGIPGTGKTDIDIIVTPGTDVDEYIRKAGTIFPFVTCEEQIILER